MLNTDSRLSACVVWLAISAIVIRALWAMLAIPPVFDLMQTFQASEVAAALARNPILVAGISGFGGLAVAYLFNGWRDRAERRHTSDRAERRMAGVLAYEARALADAIEAAARKPAGLRTRLAAIADPHDSVLLSLQPSSLARLGSGASIAVLELRRHLRALASPRDDRDEATGRQTVADALAVALTARGTAGLLETHKRKGAEIADRHRVTEPGDRDIAALAARIDAAQAPPRLVPVA